MNEQEFRQFINDALDHDQAFQVFLSNDHWLCPYCQSPVPPLKSDAGMEQRQELAVVGHVGRFCTAYRGGQGVPQDAPAMRRLANTIEFDLFVKKQLQGERAWQVIDPRMNWWCPYCVAPVTTGIAGDQVNAAQLAVTIKEHLRKCAAFGKGKGAAQPADTVVARAEDGQKAAEARARFLATVKDRVLKRHNWQFFDAEGSWYCPYCAQATMAHKPGGEYTLKERLADTVAHLEICPDFAGGRGKERTVEEMTALFKVDSEKEEIARRLVEDPVWRGADRWGNWICPYCREGCVSVGIISLDAIDDETVSLLRRHFERECNAYKSGQPAGSVEELYNKTGKTQSVADKIAKLEGAAAMGDKAEKELNRAKIIQQKMIPKTPKVPGLLIAPLYIPQEQVSGDFYDFIKVSETQWGFLVADVSGHGLEAALVMSLAKKAIAIRAESEPSPLKALAVANDDIQPETVSNMFVTLFYGVLDLKTLKLKWVRAGHNPLIVVDPSQPNPVKDYTVDGMAVGLVKTTMWIKGTVEHELQLARGQTFLQYTDGVVEAKNPAGQEFELFRLLETCRRHARTDPEELVKKLYEEVMRWTEGKPVDDDVTFLAVKIL
ncbi:MAG: PP2C family protein-serine/threonine phosphatase [Planctomycetes bacterium]|nr:PP2C family protein-serine/threonine phosphatase [Planctomycetota bacterium]